MSPIFGLFITVIDACSETVLYSCLWRDMNRVEHALTTTSKDQPPATSNHPFYVPTVELRLGLLERLDHCPSDIDASFDLIAGCLNQRKHTRQPTLKSYPIIISCSN